jgi:hypothetical protein
MFLYVVRCIFDAREPMLKFLAWLRERHVANVCHAGAEDAEIALLDPSDDHAHAIEVRYRFASRAAFERYEREQAPRLRADGLAEAARLGLELGRGVVMKRSTGEVVDWKR